MFHLSGYHKFCDGVEIITVNTLYTTRRKAAKEVADMINETITESASEKPKVTAKDCMNGYTLSSHDSDEEIGINIVESHLPKPESPKKSLFKKGDVVWVSGDISNKDYNCRVDSQGVVEADQKTARSKVLVTIDDIDGDHQACLSVDPKLLTAK
jgi:hypothetical protein